MSKISELPIADSVNPYGVFIVLASGATSTVRTEIVGSWIQGAGLLGLTTALQSVVQVSGDRLAFFNTTPVTQQSAIADPTTAHDIRFNPDIFSPVIWPDKCDRSAHELEQTTIPRIQLAINLMGDQLNYVLQTFRKYGLTT